MRKKQVLYYLFIFSLLASCTNSDDNNDSESSNLIIGKWKYYKYEYLGDDIYDPFGDVADNLCGYWHIEEFTSQGKHYMDDYGEDCEYVGSDTTNYSIQGTTLKGWYDSNDEVWYSEILTLTNSDLTLKNDGSIYYFKKMN